MEVILYLVAFYGGFFLIAKFFSWIGSLIDKRKERIRDQVATELLKGSNLEDILNEYRKKLEHIKLDKKVETWNKARYHYRKQSYSELLGKCPNCEDGYLRLRKGKYGKFLGCSTYPKCKYTINIKEAKDKYREKFQTDFISDIRKAYS